MNIMPYLKTWSDVKAELKQRFGELTDEDLSYEHGQDLEIIHRLQAKLGLSRCEVQDLLAQAF